MEEKKSTSFLASAFGAVGAGVLEEAAGCAFAVEEEFLSEVAAGDYTT